MGSFPKDGVIITATMAQQTFVLYHPKLRALYSLWLEQCTEDGLPLAAELDPADLRPWLGNLLVMDCIEGEDFIYSYYGKSFATAFGENKIGQSIGNLPEPQRQILHAEYDRVRTERLPVARVYTADFDGHTESWERLVLPLSGDGRNVEKLLVAAYELERPQAASAGA